MQEKPQASDEDLNKERLRPLCKSLQWFYHRTGGESYYYRNPFCKKFYKFFTRSIFPGGSLACSS
jgi:hypothetical protein